MLKQLHRSCALKVLVCPEFRKSNGMQSKNHDRQFVCGHREAATRNKGCDLFEKEITSGHNSEMVSFLFVY